MALWKGIVAKSFSPALFEDYVKGLRWPSWKPSFIVLHNTAAPSLAQRPGGLTLTHIRNLEAYYRDDMHWGAGPHLFVDDRQIWVFTPLTTTGVHSPSWNGVSLGIEMLGDYAKESFSSGRGLLVRQNTVRAMATLNKALGFQAGNFRFHIEDKATTHDCPGIQARKCRYDMTAEIQVAMGQGSAPATKPVVVPPPPDVPATEKPVVAARQSWGQALWDWVKAH